MNRAAPTLRRRQTLTLALLLTGYAGYYLCRSDLAVTLPLLIPALGHGSLHAGLSAEAARVRIGTIASLGVFAYALGKFPAGSLADAGAGRRSFLAGMGGAVVFTLICAISGTLPLFTLAWMGNRLIQSLGWAGALKVSSRWFPFRQYGTVMGILSLSFLFGDAAAIQFLAFLMEHGMGWRGIFAVSAGMLALLFVVCSLWLRESPREVGYAEPADEREAPALPPGTATWRSRLQGLFATPLFWLACGLSLGTTILRETFNLWTPTYLTMMAHMSPARAASSSALFPLLGGVSVLFCGWLSDHLGRGGRAAIMALGLSAAAAVLWAMTAGLGRGSAPETVMLIALIGFLVIGPYSFLAGAVALDFGGRTAGATASGWIDGIGYLGGVISGDTIARLSVTYGWDGAFRFLAAVAATGALAALGWTLVSRGPSVVRQKLQSL